MYVRLRKSDLSALIGPGVGKNVNAIELARLSAFA
jgi:hypothetical protein